MSEINVYGVVKKLVGPVDPVGAEHVDGKRFENLKVMTALVEQLVFKLDNVASYKDRQEYSMKKAGEFADGFLENDLGIKE